jgi:hypothetical protein
MMISDPWFIELWKSAMRVQMSASASACAVGRTPRRSERGRCHEQRPDILRAARLLVKRHGADAPIVAAQRADELFEQGDLDGVVVWKRILHAVEELQRVTPKVGGRVN